MELKPGFVTIWSVGIVIALTMVKIGITTEYFGKVEEAYRCGSVWEPGATFLGLERL